MPSSGIEESSFRENLRCADYYLARLQQLPDESDFVATVEDDFWATVTAQSQPPDEVPYTDLPDRTHSLIGTYDTEEGPSEPWWLQEFTWTAAFGGEEIELRGDSLKTFAENFDRNRTVIQKPTLRTGYSSGTVRNALGAFETIKNELEGRIEPARDDSVPKLPESLFTVGQGLVEPTDSFGKWIDEFLSLAPGISPEATALYLAQTGTSEEAIKSAVDTELFEVLDPLVGFQSSSYKPKIVTEFNTILELSRAFNRIIPVDESYEQLSGLQYQLYRGFLETFEPADEFTEELFDAATRGTPSIYSSGEQGLFTRIACGTPLLSYGNKRPKLMSVRMYSPKTSGSSGYSSSAYRDVRALFEAYGWFDNA